jgi:hypothetical protein
MSGIIEYWNIIRGLNIKVISPDQGKGMTHHWLQIILQWAKMVSLTTQEAEIRRITVQSQPRQIVHKTLS